MKIFHPLLILFLLLASCDSKDTATKSEKSVSNTDTVFIHDTVYINDHRNWQDGWDLTHNPDEDSISGKPVSYYLRNKNCSPVAADFYYGVFKPTDSRTTAELLSLVTTKNNSLRPFYRWCLDITIQIQDGALAEYTGVPARKYAEKYPAEFFEYMDKDNSGQRCANWESSIAYSGFYREDDFKKPTEIRQ